MGTRNQWLCIAAGLAVALSSGVMAHAANLQWIAPAAGGDWNVATNWIPNQVPTSADTTFFNNSSTGPATVDSADAANTIFLGQGNGNGTIDVTGGTLTTGNFYLGVDSGRNGILNQTGGTINNAGTTVIGNGQFSSGGTGTANISGGTFNTTGNLQLDTAPSSAATSGGILNISGGTVNAGNIQVGDGLATAQVGAVTISNGGTLNWQGFYDNRTSSATLTVTGSGDTITGNRAAGGDGLLLNSHNSVNFNFDSSGISAVNLKVSNLSIGTSATLNVNGNGFSKAGTYTLFSFGANDLNQRFAAANLTGFGAGSTPTLNYNANSITLSLANTSVPEPATLGLLAIGGVALLRRRKTARV